MEFAERQQKAALRIQCLNRGRAGRRAAMERAAVRS